MNQKTTKYILLALFLLMLTLQLEAQHLLSPWADTMKRELIILNEDSSDFFQENNIYNVDVYVKKRKDNRIKELSKYYYKDINDKIYYISEVYQNQLFQKRWYITIDEEVFTGETKARNGRLIQNYKSIRHTIYEYNLQGKLTDYWGYKNDKLENNIHKSFTYYPNGELQGVFEWKSLEGKKHSVLWNILDYRHEDGTPYDYGTLKDGTGKVFHISSEGYWCKPTYYEDGEEIKK